MATGKQTGTFKGHEALVVSLIAQGDAVISGAARQDDPHLGRENDLGSKIDLRAQGDGDALAMTKAGHFLATAGLNNAIRIFDAKTGAEVIHAPGPQAGLVSLARIVGSRAARLDHQRRANFRLERQDGQAVQAMGQPADGRFLPRLCP